MGDPAVSLEETMLSIQTANVSFQSLVQVRNRMVSAYHDIMNMQIFVVDLLDNREIWRARQEFFSGDFPCSTLIQVVRVGSPQASPAHRVEINCSGYVGGSLSA